MKRIFLEFQKTPMGRIHRLQCAHRFVKLRIVRCSKSLHPQPVLQPSLKFVLNTFIVLTRCIFKSSRRFILASNSSYWSTQIIPALSSCALSLIIKGLTPENSNLLFPLINFTFRWSFINVTPAPYNVTPRPNRWFVSILWGSAWAEPMAA